MKSVQAIAKVLQALVKYAGVVMVICEAIEFAQRRLGERYPVNNTEAEQQ